MADKAPSSQEKLGCYLELHNIVGSGLTMWSGKAAGADDIMPLVVYLIVQAAPKRLPSNLK